MKNIASLCLIFGLLIMVTAWSVAVSAMSDNDSMIKVVERTPNACLFCHVDAHATWEQSIVMPQMVEAFAVFSEPDVHETANPSTPAQICINCHTMNEKVLDISIEDIQAQFDVTVTRVTLLREDLSRIYEYYPDWDSNIYRFEKSEAQILAERIGTLIEVIEAEGSWGFHQLNYTEEILAEAEALMTEVLSQTGL